MSQEEIIVLKGWELSTIGQISKIKGGSKIPSNENLGTKLHFIKVSDMNLKENFQYIIKPNLIITTSKKNIIENSIPPNSILIPKRGGAILTNKKRITSENSLLDPNIMAIIPTSKIEPLFLYYFFLKTDLTNFVGGEVVPQLNKYDIEPLKIFYPHNKKTQKQIVTKLDHVLGELEVKKKEILSLIENNKERINFFEKNWMSYIIKNELEKDSQQKGWVSSTIEEISEIKGSGTIPVNENLGTKLHFIKVSDMNLKENFQYIIKPNLIITTSKKNIIENSIPPNSILIPKRGGAILTNKKRITSENSLLDPNIMAIIPTSKIEPLFLYYFFLKTNLAQFVGGEVIPQLNKYDIAPLEIKYPKEREAQNKIIQNIKNAEEKFKSQKKQFENIKNNYESKINYVNHIQSSILDSAFSGKLIQ